MSKWTPRSHTYRKLCAQVKREEPICWLCGKQIDPRLRRPDPMCYSTDHIKPASKYPELAEVRSNLHAAHLRCNQKRGAGRRPKAKSDLEISVREF